MAKRKSLSKKTRFEVFKRDKFKCQYCGGEAPNIVLVVDHIRPVADGGDNAMVNLITSCFACNAGKSDRLLSDDSAVHKQRAQLEELQERREQLEMIMQWREFLIEAKDDTVQQIADYWDTMTPGWKTNDRGKRTLKSLMSKYSVDEIMSAMDVAGDRYLKFKADGNATNESVGIGFEKIGGICKGKRLESENPEYAKALHVMYYCRKSMNYLRERDCIDLIMKARANGVEWDAIWMAARSSRNWYAFETAILEAQ